MLLQNNDTMYASLVSPSTFDLLQNLDDMSWSSSDDDSSYTDDDSTSAYSASTASMSMDWMQDSFRGLDVKGMPSSTQKTKMNTTILKKPSIVVAPRISASGTEDIPRELMMRIQNAHKEFSSSPPITEVVAPSKPQSPQDFLVEILSSRGVNPKPDIKPCDLYVQLSEENVKAFTMNKTTAIRADDVAALRQMYENGEMLLCSTQFGESILHIACRKGSINCVKYMVQELGLPVQLADDYNKNLFHDACWTSKPNFEIAKILLDSCPELLLMPDKRGFFPLQYVPKNNWAEWCAFLDQEIASRF